MNARERRRYAQFKRLPRVDAGTSTVELWACAVCGCLVDSQQTDTHLEWHNDNGR